MHHHATRFTAIIIIVAVIGIGVFSVYRSYSSNQAQADASHNISNGQITTITYDGHTFEPEIVSIKPGQAVTITNQSTDNLRIASSPHPNHTDNAELNLENIDPGVSKQVVLSTPGEWKFHNHDSPMQTGKIIVRP